MTVLPAGTPPIPITMVGKFKTHELYYHCMSEHYWSVLLWDTAAPWCILNPAIVEQMSPNSMERVGEDRQNIRGIKYEGDLIRTNIKLHADYGEDLVIDATIFVPILKFDEVWNLPNFLGLDGFLHRLRFAVDPQSNTFYFGMIAD